MKRVRMTMAHYNEIVQSRDWCAKNGMNGMRAWYDEYLDFQARRRALPLGVQPAQTEDVRPAR